MPNMQNLLVYTMISTVVVITIYIADKQQKLYVIQHPPDAAAAANHTKSEDFTKICQPTNALIRILVRLWLRKFIFSSGGSGPGDSGPGGFGLGDSVPGTAAPAPSTPAGRIENVEK
jgi:hypothetical protein